ncbi:uncharacterized protein [Chiloscyllium punctatum]|uniref:uncharacterized protein n=1 Tax=Chiloscyllium punctatum TaxID=137246 RepID=UPI003B63B7D2
MKRLKRYIRATRVGSGSCCRHCRRTVTLKRPGNPVHRPRKKGLLTQTPPLEFAVHQIRPGDWVLIKTWKDTKLHPSWEGPFLTLLTTQTAVRTAEKGWSHHTHVEGPVDAPSPSAEWKKGVLTQTPPLEFTVHQIRPGDWVLINTWKDTKLHPSWEGPFLTLLTTQTAVRTAEKGWSHHTHVEGPVDAPSPSAECLIA